MFSPGRRGTTRTVLLLGSTQTLAWASSYYLPAMLAAPMARSVGVSTPTVFAAFSMALILSALVGPLAGRAIDRHGGRPVLMATNVLFVLGLLMLASAQGLPMLVAGWAVLGVAMGAGLYEAAFAALVRLYGAASRNPITGITLLGGFASTVGWPLSALMEQQFGWRAACVGWAVLHVLIGLPLNAMLPRRAEPQEALAESAPQPATTAPEPAARTEPPRYTAALLSLVFTLQWFVGTGMAAHLPTVMQAVGGTLALAVTVGALVGPSQVLGRLLEFGVLRRWSSLAVARGAALAHPLGALLMLSFGAAAALPFAVLHGLGNGILTIAKGTLPLALFGAAGYGARQGWLALPGRVMQGLAPWLFGIALERWGAGALWLSASLCVAAFAALLCLRLPQR